ELMSMPVPAAWPLPSVVLISTIAGITLAATASVLALLDEPPGLGVTCVIGDSGCAVDCATLRLFTARARLHPIPAPAAAATSVRRAPYPSSPGNDSFVARMPNL